jgi:hypothetical protein
MRAVMVMIVFALGSIALPGEAVAEGRDLACGGAPPNCDFGCVGRAQSGEPFIYDSEVYQQIRVSHPLAALLLSNIASKETRAVTSMVVTGTANVGEGPFAYKARVTADASRVVLDLVFDHLDGGPVLQPISIEVDRHGLVNTSSLAADDADTIRRASRDCGQPQADGAAGREGPDSSRTTVG